MVLADFDDGLDYHVSESTTGEKDLTIIQNYDYIKLGISEYDGAI